MPTELEKEFNLSTYWE